jgi:hypothetical protein
MGWTVTYPSLREVVTAARDGVLDRLVRRLEERGAQHDATAFWLARALTIDLATLYVHPDLVLQTVWRRAYHVRLNSGRAPVRGLLQRWRVEHGDQPWARALRPAPDPLSGPLVEEYRGDFATVDAVLLRADEVVLLRDGAVVRSLIRRTGATAPQPARPLPVATKQPWRVPDRSAAGVCRVIDRVTGDVVSDVPVDRSLRIDDLVLPAAGPTAFAVGSDADGYGSVLRIDTEAATVRWRWAAGSPVGTVWCAPDASFVLACVDDWLTVLDGRTGTVLGRQLIGEGCCAVDWFGTRIAVVDRCSVRVLEAGRFNERLTYGLPGSGETLVDVLWSPNGRRLLTGGVLCNGRTGAAISSLRLESPRYLMGGPAEGCLALGDGVLVELGAMRGVRRWHTGTAALLQEFPDRWYSAHRDQLAIAPQAHLFVHARPGSRASLRRTDDQEIVAHLDDRPVVAAAWAPDSSRFATGHSDGTVTVWDRHGTRLHRLGPGGEAGRTVRGLAWSVNGTVLVVDQPAGSGPGQVLSFWDTATGHLRGTRRSGPGGGITLSLGHHSGRDLEHLHGQFGFLARRHPYHAHRVAGFVMIEPDSPNLPSYRVADHGPLRADPTGTRWASRTTHVALEPGVD